MNEYALYMNEWFLEKKNLVKYIMSRRYKKAGISPLFSPSSFFIEQFLHKSLYII